MGYLLLYLSVFFGAVKGYCGKKLGNQTTGVKKSVLLNCKRMVYCCGFGLLVLVLLGDLKYILPNAKMLLIFAVSGIGTTVFVVSWLLSVRKNAYMMLDVSLMCGTLVPMVASSLVFGETVSLRQWIGFVVLIIATVIMSSYNSSVKGSLSIASLVLLLVAGLTNGVVDFSQKYFVKQFAAAPVSLFNFYTYVFSGLSLTVFLLLLPKENSAENKPENSQQNRKETLYVLIMAFSLTANSYFKTMAASHLGSAQLYPLCQGSAMLVSMLMAHFFFKEKLNLKAVMGIIIAFAALLIMNL